MPRSGVKLKTVNTVIVVAFLQKKKKKKEDDDDKYSIELWTCKIRLAPETGRSSPAQPGPCGPL